MLVRFQKILKR